MPMQLAEVACNDLLLLRRKSDIMASRAEYGPTLLIPELVRISLFVPAFAGFAELRQWSKLVCVDVFARCASSDWSGGRVGGQQ